MIVEARCTVEDLLTAVNGLLLPPVDTAVEKSILYDLYGPTLTPAATARMWQTVLCHTYGSRFDLLEEATELSNRSVALVSSKSVGALHNLVDKINLIDKQCFAGTNQELLRETSNNLIGFNPREGAYWFGNVLGVLASWLPKLHVMSADTRDDFYVMLRNPVVYNMLNTDNIPDILGEGLDWYREMRALYETVAGNA